MQHREELETGSTCQDEGSNGASRFVMPSWSSVVAVLGLLGLASLALAPLQSGAAERTTEPVQPVYDADGQLLLPKDFAEWILAGSSLALSYSDAPLGHDMFHFTLIEPSAYEHFSETGRFREGTMFALLLHGVGEGALPSRQGRYAAEAHMLEMAVKDSSRNEGSWAYYNFTGPQGLRDSAPAMPRGSCQQCHAEHAAFDNVFLQFYPLLVDAAPEGAVPASLTGAFRRSARSSDDDVVEPPARQASSDGALALGGLDPVHLHEGREEMGKAEIVLEHDGLRYRFVSEPSRAAFEASPERYLSAATDPAGDR